MGKITQRWLAERTEGKRKHKYIDTDEIDQGMDNDDDTDEENYVKAIQVQVINCLWFFYVCADCCSFS